MAPALPFPASDAEHWYWKEMTMNAETRQQSAELSRKITIHKFLKREYRKAQLAYSWSGYDRHLSYVLAVGDALMETNEEISVLRGTLGEAQKNADVPYSEFSNLTFNQSAAYVYVTIAIVAIAFLLISTAIGW